MTCCKGLCDRFKLKWSPKKGVYSNGVMMCRMCSDFAHTCYIDMKGVVIRHGKKYCKCCNYLVRTTPTSQNKNKVLNKSN